MIGCKDDVKYTVHHVSGSYKIQPLGVSTRFLDEAVFHVSIVFPCFPIKSSTNPAPCRCPVVASAIRVTLVPSVPPPVTWRFGHRDVQGEKHVTISFTDLFDFFCYFLCLPKMDKNIFMSQKHLPLPENCCQGSPFFSGVCEKTCSLYTCPAGYQPKPGSTLGDTQAEAAVLLVVTELLLVLKGEDMVDM